ncbi:MAG: hypothetical protein IJJ33_08915 [Victivallales bacterium]|nr:hypothetical protein [Victivallales bacterium]
MLEITNLRQGAILNHNHGQESDKSLKVRLEGISDAGYPVKVNGVPAQMDGRRFCADIELTRQFNDVKASVLTPFGTYSQDITLVWDKRSFKRVNFYIDDHSFFFTDLAKERPAHAFDHFYLAHLKRLHDLYGLKVALNCFYSNDHANGFSMSEVPDIWKQEFIDNSDWLKFTLHAPSEFPDRPWIESNAEVLVKYFNLLKKEVTRWAGEESYAAPNILHWGNIHPTVAQALFECGCRAYTGSMIPCVMGGPSLADRQKGGSMAEVEKRSLSGEDRAATTEGIRLHYDVPERESYVANHCARYMPELGIFLYTNMACLNLVPLKEVLPVISAALKRYAATGAEVCNYLSHEQYSFPYYSNYEPDHLERLEVAAKYLHEQGYRYVFFNEGLLGNTAWN